MATHPKLSFHNSGVSGNPSQVVIPHFWHQWRPIPSCYSTIWASVTTHPKLEFKNYPIFQE
eukprot:5804385-Amphidinium_carterae.1